MAKKGSAEATSGISNVCDSRTSFQVVFTHAFIWHEQPLWNEFY